MAKIPTDPNLQSPMGDMNIAVALGAIKGWQYTRLFGMNENVNGAGTEEDVWPPGTVKTWPTAAAVAAVVSDNAADAAAGTGARKVIIEGLDADYNEVIEEVTLNGLTPVNSTTEFLRINWFYCTEVGTGGVNAGNLTVSIGGDDQKYIEAGQGNCHCAYYTVPAGHTYYVDLYSIGVGRMAGSTDAHILGWIRLYDEDSNNNYQSWRAISDIYLWNGQNYQNADAVTAIPEKSDLRISIISTSATQTYGIFGGYLVNNATQGNF